jgi:uncharacterized DUF497 family protein
MEFEWDESKRQKVLEKHGIDFWRATALWDGNHVVLEARIGTEFRQKAVGFLDGWWVVVVFTRRGDKLRLVTARRARENEKRAYRSVYN